MGLQSMGINEEIRSPHEVVMGDVVIPPPLPLWDPTVVSSYTSTIGLALVRDAVRSRSRALERSLRTFPKWRTRGKE